MAKLPNKFAIFLQYLMKSEWDKVDCLHAQDHEGFLQINTMVLIGMVKHSKVAIKVNLQSLYNISNNKLKMSWFFACR